MRPRRDRKEPVSEPGAEDVLELQALGLVHGHDLDRVGPRRGRLGVVGGAGQQRVEGHRHVGQQRLAAVEALEHILDVF